MEVDMKANTDSTTTYFNYGETEEKELMATCESCGKSKNIKWVEQKQPFVFTGEQLETINTYLEELNKACFVYLVGDRTYFFCEKCFGKIFKKED